MLSSQGQHRAATSEAFVNSHGFKDEDDELNLVHEAISPSKRLGIPREMNLWLELRFEAYKG